MAKKKKERKNKINNSLYSLDVCYAKTREKKGMSERIKGKVRKEQEEKEFNGVCWRIQEGCSNL